jgi:WXG100 family type VII secretion target
MDIKVKHEELGQVKKVMEKDAEDFNSDIELLAEQVKILHEIWQGQDADIFYVNASEFFDKMKGLPVAMRAMGKFIGQANGDFQDGDESFSKELETEADEYEQDYYNRQQ